MSNVEAVGPSSEAGTARETELRELYIDLLRKALMHTLYRPIDVRPLPAHVVEAFMEPMTEILAAGTELSFHPLDLRNDGQDIPVYGQTMVGLARMNNVQSCVETVLRDDVPGDFIEAGVWRGGVSIFMRGILKAWGDRARHVVVADSFQGLPASNATQYPADGGLSPEEAGRFAVSRPDVQQNFESYGLLDEQVEFVEGWFSDSLPALRGRTWSILRLDGDLYESTMDTLVNLYDGLSPGGFVIVDDYVLPPCRQAIDEFRAERGIDDEIVPIDWAGAFWRRSTSS